MQLQHVFFRRVPIDNGGHLEFLTTRLHLNQPVIPHQPIRRIPEREAPLIVGDEPYFFDRRIVAGVECPRVDFIDMPAQHGVGNELGFDVAGDALGKKFVEVGGGFVVGGDLEFWREDQMHFTGRQQTSTGGEPLVAPL